MCQIGILYAIGYGREDFYTIVSDMKGLKLNLLYSVWWRRLFIAIILVESHSESF